MYLLVAAVNRITLSICATTEGGEGGKLCIIIKNILLIFNV